ncbi:hypothetical protein [Rubrolithibacter danxiaensis]|uniref:hypothetical protein n=1 Tax=Rubrolithibacter danxiaensis TaxID=3390805 RepID=UPI003BF7E523
MKRLWLSILLFLPVLLQAQINSGPRFTALGNTGVSLQDVWSLQSNQAGLAALSYAVIAGAYERKYLNEDLSTQSAVIAVPFNTNVFGLSFQNYGFSVYNEQRMGFTYARKFGKTIFAALDFNYHQVKIQQYGSAKSFSVEGGLQYKPYEKLCIGTHISNPNNSGFTTEVDAVIPVTIEFGASYQFTDKILLSSALAKTLKTTSDFKIGLEYIPVSWIALRGGFSANPVREYAGVGFEYEKFHFDFASSSHPVLGFSPQVAFSYEF